MFGIMVARENPEAQIVALDWEPVLAVAAENAAAAGISDRHELLPGDALQVDYGRDFDIVVTQQNLHELKSRIARRPQNANANHDSPSHQKG